MCLNCLNRGRGESLNLLLSNERMEVPKWFDDPDAPWPCPCGQPPYGPMVLAEKEDGGTIMLHLSCAQEAGLTNGD